MDIACRGFFILFSYMWGWAVDGTKPDTGMQRGWCVQFTRSIQTLCVAGDWIGMSISVTGVSVCYMWPRKRHQP